MFGLQRSGTNYLHWLLSENTPAVVVRDGGWKHAFPDEPRPTVHVDVVEAPAVLCRRRGIRPVVVRKDFDHWQASLSRNPKDYDRGDHRQVWAEFHDRWSALAPVVRYEDFLADFDPALDRLADMLGVRPHSYRQPSTVANSPKWRRAHRERYL